MSTIICHNILVDPNSLSAKLHPHMGWSCIEALSHASNLQKNTPEKFEVYVHPLDKSTKSVLSEKSLEMCTENLGSETGTDTTEDDIFSIMSLDSEAEEPTPIATTERIITRKPRQTMESCRKAGYESLPPPLTATIRVQPHRESGRLVMMAVSTPPRSSSILVERSNGRLKMSLMEELSVEEEDDDVECGECEEEGGGLNGESAEEDLYQHNVIPLKAGSGESAEEDLYQHNVIPFKAGSGVSAEEDLYQPSVIPLKAGSDESVEEDTEGINKEVGEKFGIGEFQRVRRCKEGGRGSRRFINWETFWVAT